MWSRGEGCQLFNLFICDGITGVEIVPHTEGEGLAFTMPVSGKVHISAEFEREMPVSSWQRSEKMSGTDYFGSSHAITYNAGGKRLENLLGVTYDSMLSWLRQHEHDNYYIGTPYAASHRNGGSDNRQPNGDTPVGMTYGNDDYKGHSSMNCTGFVWHTLWKATGCDYKTAYDAIPCWGGIGPGGWSTYLRRNAVEYRTYYINNGGTSAWDMNQMVRELVDDGYIETGDILWMWDASVNMSSDGLPSRSSDYHHVGIYLGKELGDPTNDTQLWHSTRNSIYNPGLQYATNQISLIAPVKNCCAMTVIKLGQSKSGGEQTEEQQPSIDGVIYHTDTICAVGKEQYIDGHWYLLDKQSGQYVRGFAYLEDAGKWVYYDPINSQMLYGEQCINGHWYLFDQCTGAVTYGFAYIEKDNKWVFYDRVMGWMLYGEQYIDGGWYYLTPGTGAVDYGWAWLPHAYKWVYYDTVSGRMYHGWHRVEGRMRHFDEYTGEILW